MQKIFWIGEPYFAGDLEACGWEQVYVHYVKEYRTYSWRDIVTIAGFEPDVVVVADSSLPPVVLGVEEFPCLTVFYSVDSHIHSWHPLYAQAFDASLVSLYDNLEHFSGAYLHSHNVWWSPAFARKEDQPRPEIEKSVDCLFVGTNNANLMPKRAEFLEKLGKNVPGLQVRSGNFRKLFPTGRVLVNQAEHGDLNFRVFEAMGCGGCLVTPRIGNGLDKMFVDGEHMVAYAPHDAGDAAYRINFLLAHPDLCEHIAREGYEKINGSHRSIHRAQAFTDHVCDLAITGLGGVIAQRHKNAAGIRKQYLALPYMLWAEQLTGDAERAAFMAAAKGDYGLNGLDNRKYS